MANPNIVDVTSIFGKTATQFVGDVFSPIVTCPNDTIIKINSLYITATNSENFNGSISVRISKSVGDNTRLADEIAVPDSSSLVLISKDSSIYLEEGDSLDLRANDVGFLDATCSYEEIT